MSRIPDSEVGKSKYCTHALAALVCLCVALISCGRGVPTEVDTSTQVVDNFVRSVDHLDMADRDWAGLLSVSASLERAASESALQYFFRRAEIERQNFRRKGLDFWRNHPNDLRRYSWLLLTVHMAPEYPENVFNWARKEADLGANSAARDEQAISEWSDVYRSLREELLAAESVTAEQMRFFQSGELSSRLNLLERFGAEHGRVDVHRLAEDLVSFSIEYASPSGVTDFHGHRYIFGRLFNPKTLDLFVESEVELNQFAERLASTENESDHVLWFVEALINRDDENGFVQIRRNHKARPFDRLPKFPSTDESLWEAKVFNHYRLINYRTVLRYRGASIWNQMNQDERYLYLGRTAYDPPFHAKHLIGAAVRMTNDRWYSGFEVDEEEHRNGEIVYLTLRNEYWSHSDTTDLARFSISDKEIFSQRTEALRLWDDYRDNSGSLLLIKELTEFWEEYGDIKRVKSIASDIVSNHAAFGLSDEQTRNFLRELGASGSSEFQYLESSFENLMALRQTPFEIEAPTLHGEDFSISDTRGLIVLVDHWATTCSACVASMPLIHDVYSRYRDKGFEVISIAYDGLAKKKLVTRYKQELGLTWTTLLADGQWDEISARYGYVGFPQYMLLRRDGTLYAGTHELNSGRNLEILLDEMLAAEVAEKEAATVR